MKYGIVLEAKVGNKVQKDSVLAYIHANDSIKLKEAKEQVLKVIKIRDEVVKEQNTILDVI